MITQEMHNRVVATIQSCIKKILGQSYELDVPVTYRRDMKAVAGCAYVKSKRIELNEVLFLENVEQFFSRTIPHEVAHVITRIIYPHAKQAHGPEWRNVMSMLGVDDNTRCHSYDVSSVVKPRLSEKFTYVCSCDRPLILSKIMHNKIQRGSVRICMVCKTPVSHKN